MITTGAISSRANNAEVTSAVSVRIIKFCYLGILSLQNNVRAIINCQIIFNWCLGDLLLPSSSAVPCEFLVKGLWGSQALEVFSTALWFAMKPYWNSCKLKTFWHNVKNKSARSRWNCTGSKVAGLFPFHS